MPCYIRLILLAAAVLALPAGPGARAQQSPWVETRQAELRLVSGRAALGMDGAIEAGVVIRMAPGWKTYWRMPGEAGLAPEFDWSGSENLAQATVAWPAPRRISILGIDSFVYEREVVFPVMLRAQRADRPLRLHLKLSYGICHSVCIPAEHELALEVPPGPGVPSVHAPLIAAYADRVPRDAAAAGVTLRARTLTEQDRLLLVVEAESAEPFVSPDLFVEAPAPLWFGPAEVALHDQGRRAVFRATITAGLRPPDPAGATLRLTLTDPGRAVEAEITLPR